MKFLFASDSFKGTLSSRKIGKLLTVAAKEVFPDCSCDRIEVADGGEGTTQAVLSTVAGQQIEVSVHGAFWEKVTASYGKLDDRRAVMEMAVASGLPMVAEKKKILERQHHMVPEK